jgi:hypothetical protein
LSMRQSTLAQSRNTNGDCRFQVVP